MVRGYTTIEQSKKLLELGLDPSTADMMYREYETVIGDDYGYAYKIQPFYSSNIDDIPCWSLAALLDVLPEPELIQTSESKWLIRCWTKNRNPWSVGGYENPIDACYEMILKLHELNLL